MIRATPRLWAIWQVTRRYGLSEFWNGRLSNDPRPRGERLRLALQVTGWTSVASALNYLLLLPPLWGGPAARRHIRAAVRRWVTAGRRDVLHASITAPAVFVRFIGNNHKSVHRTYRFNGNGDGTIDRCDHRSQKFQHVQSGRRAVIPERIVR